MRFAGKGMKSGCHPAGLTERSAGLSVWVARGNGWAPREWKREAGEALKPCPVNGFEMDGTTSRVVWEGGL